MIESGKSGLLAPAGDTDGLARHLDRLASDSGLRAGLIESAATRLSAEFDIRKMVEGLDSLYLDLLENRA